MQRCKPRQPGGDNIVNFGASGCGLLGNGGSEKPGVHLRRAGYPLIRAVARFMLGYHLVDGRGALQGFEPAVSYFAHRWMLGARVLAGEPADAAPAFR